MIVLDKRTFFFYAALNTEGLFLSYIQVCLEFLGDLITCIMHMNRKERFQIHIEEEFGVCISEQSTALDWRTIIVSDQVVGLDDHCRFFPPEISILF